MGKVAKAGNRGGSPEAQRERAATTRTAVLAAARALFGGIGYHATGTTEIVERAAMTRGALYHHFTGKEDLFEAVFREVLAELVERTNAGVASMSGQLWPQVIRALQRYLDLVAASAEYRRILLIDGPAVLGWARWRELESEFVGSGMAAALQMLMDQNLIAPQPAEPLAFLVQAALNDAALTIASADRPEQTAPEVTRAFLSLVEGLRRG
ncbi:MAG: TetR/AcrR family transcriptional regulator [Sphingomonadales bacterium]|nr:TetR/AcrR family transcriptional regulator [Sphingomonadales bacterium]